MPRSTIVIVMLTLLGAAGFGLAIGHAAGGGSVAPRARTATSLPASEVATTANASPVASPPSFATPMAAMPAGGSPSAAPDSPVATPASAQTAADRPVNEETLVPLFTRETRLGSPIVAEPTIPSEATKWPTSDGTDGANGGVSTAAAETSTFQRAGVVARGER